MIRDFAIFGGSTEQIVEKIKLDSSKITNQNVRLNVQKPTKVKNTNKVKKLKR